MPDYVSAERELLDKDPLAANDILLKSYKILSAIVCKLEMNPPFYFKWILLHPRDYLAMTKGQRLSYSIDDKETRKAFMDLGPRAFLRMDGVQIIGHRDAVEGKIRYVTNVRRQSGYQDNWFLREVASQAFSLMDAEAIPETNREKISLHYLTSRNDIVASTPLPLGYELIYSGADDDGIHTWRVTVIVGSERISEVADAATRTIHPYPPSNPF